MCIMKGQARHLSFLHCNYTTYIDLQQPLRAKMLRLQKIFSCVLHLCNTMYDCLVRQSTVHLPIIIRVGYRTVERQ